MLHAAVGCLNGRVRYDLDIITILSGNIALAIPLRIVISSQFTIFSGIFGAGRQVTVLSLAKKYCSLKIGVRESTKRGYKTVLNFLEKDSFGALNIGSIRRSDAKAWLVKLQKENGKSYSTIHTIRGVLRPAFQMAVDDELLTYNPFDFEMVSVIVNDSVRREAITRDEERRFLEFVKNDRHFSRYYEGIYILFNTGLRISEFCGLTRSDIDFKKHCFQVDKQLIRGADMVYMIEKPKTEAGTRTIPMSSEVESCFKRIIDNRRCKTKEVIVDGVGGFLYLDKNGMPMTALHWEHYFQHIVEKYNKIYKLQMPKVTPHVCRHTFCIYGRMNSFPWQKGELYDLGFLQHFYNTCLPEYDPKQHELL